MKRKCLLLSISLLTTMLTAFISPHRFQPPSAPDNIRAGRTLIPLNPQAIAEVTETPTLETPAVYGTQNPYRPMIVINAYEMSEYGVGAGQDVDLIVVLYNTGRSVALNLVISFSQGDLVSRFTGGVLALKELDPGEKRRVSQPMSTTYSILGKSFAAVTMDISYTDETGTSYSQTYNLNIPVAQPSGNTITPTPTATAIPRPQLVIGSYSTDTSVLSPGRPFNLTMQIKNVGATAARRVSLIMGGGSATMSAVSTGTPESGGISGGSGDFAIFAPVNSSNVQYLGDVDVGGSRLAIAPLIVNAGVNPGAYPVKISFTYDSDNGASYTDDQVVTLLVFVPPMLEVSFYRDADPAFVGQQSQLPLQVVNMGRKAIVLGNIKVTSKDAELSNNTSLIGPLDAGGYFTLDVNATPLVSGTVDLLVTIRFTDDFNQPQSITQTVSIEAAEALVEEELPGGNGAYPSPTSIVAEPETISAWWGRLIRGLLGLDSGRPAQEAPLMPPGGSEMIMPRGALPHPPVMNG